jgi:integrase/recombinase XerC
MIARAKINPEGRASVRMDVSRIGKNCPVRSVDGDNDNLAGIQPIHRIRATDYSPVDAGDFEPAALRGLRTPAGFVMLFDEDFHPIEPANVFLLEHCHVPARRDRWQKTQTAYADDLVHWWTYLRLNGLAWDAVGADDLRNYAQALVEGVSTRGQRFSSSTVSRRIGTVEALYNWAHRRGLVQECPVVEARAKRRIALDRAFLPHTGGISVATASILRPKPMPVDEHVNPIAMRDLTEILAQLGASPYEIDENDARPIRDRLIAEVSLYTGMRVEEVVALTIYQILDVVRGAELDDPWRPWPLRITVTKGGVPRTVLIPTILVKALLSYVDGERASVVDAARLVGKSSSNALFLNGVRATARDIGGKCSPATAMRAFHAATLSAGLTRTIAAYRIDPATGAPAVDERGEEVLEPTSVAKHSFHDLRHTFATQFYWGEIRAGNAAPWKKLQARLGHRRLSTTQDIYLRHVETREPEISDAFAQLLKEGLDALG